MGPTPCSACSLGAFQSLNGNFASPPAATNVLETWNCALGVPLAGGEQVHLNLWLDNGNPPANNEPVEAILSQFEFVPLGTPQPAQLGPLTTRAGAVELSVRGLADWHYDLFSTSDLMTWLPLGTVAPTNDFFQFADPNPATLSPRFYRTVTEP